MRQPRSPRRPMLLLGVLCLAQVSLVLDLVVVVVALPSIGGDLGISGADLRWVMVAYGLTYGGFMIAGGRCGDLLGHRRVFLVGLTLFTAAAAGAGLAPFPSLLFVARALQGIGAALVTPTALALVTTAFAQGSARNRALGFWGAAASGGAAAGSLLGGLLTELVHWRAIFLINVPISAVVLVGVGLAVRSDRPLGGERLDLPGASLLTAGGTLFVGGVTVTGTASGFAVGLMMLGSVGMFGAFLAVERRTAHPLVRLSIFGSPQVRYGNLICVLVAATPLVTQYYATLYLQTIAGLSPLWTGLAFVPVTVSIVAISGKAGPLAARFGVHRMLTAGAVLSGCGLSALALTAFTSQVWFAAMPGLLLSGAAAGLSYAPSMIVSTTGVTDSEQGLASGLLNTSHQLGGAVGLAVVTTMALLISGTAAGASHLGVGFLVAIALPVLTVATVLALPREAPHIPSPRSRPSLDGEGRPASHHGSIPGLTPDGLPATGALQSATHPCAQPRGGLASAPPRRPRSMTSPGGLSG